MITNSDIEVTYNKLINCFYELFPDRNDIIKIEIADMTKYVTNLCDSLRMQPKYFNLLLKRDNRMFKGLNLTLLPKLKMEVILNIVDENESRNKIINEMWDTIFLLYLIGENDHSEPDKTKMSQIASMLNKVSDSVNNVSSIFDKINKDGNIQSMLNHLNDVVNDDKVKNMMSSIGLDDTKVKNIMSSIDLDDTKVKNIMSSINPNENILNNMKDVMSNIGLDDTKVKNIMSSINSNENILNNMKDMMSNINMDNVKDVMSNIGLDTDKMKPTENSNKLVSDIVSDLKSSLKMETTDGKVDSKQFVDNLMNVGNTLGLTYSKKLSSGELSLNDIIGAVSSIASNDTNPLNELSDLQLDKLDMTEVLGELKNKMNDKIPTEFLDTINNLQNVDMSSLINLMGSNTGNNDVKELTLEQKKELEKYYEDLKL